MKDPLQEVLRDGFAFVGPQPKHHWGHGAGERRHQHGADVVAQVVRRRIDAQPGRAQHALDQHPVAQAQHHRRQLHGHQRQAEAQQRLQERGGEIADRPGLAPEEPACQHHQAQRFGHDLRAVEAPQRGGDVEQRHQHQRQAQVALEDRIQRQHAAQLAGAQLVDHGAGQALQQRQRCHQVQQVAALGAGGEEGVGQHGDAQAPEEGSQRAEARQPHVDGGLVLRQRPGGLAGAHLAVEAQRCLLQAQLAHGGGGGHQHADQAHHPVVGDREDAREKRKRDDACQRDEQAGKRVAREVGSQPAQHGRHPMSIVIPAAVRPVVPEWCWSPARSGPARRPARPSGVPCPAAARTSRRSGCRPR